MAVVISLRETRPSPPRVRPSAWIPNIPYHCDSIIDDLGIRWDWWQPLERYGLTIGLILLHDPG